MNKKHSLLVFTWFILFGWSPPKIWLSSRACDLYLDSSSAPIVVARVFYHFFGSREIYFGLKIFCFKIFLGLTQRYHIIRFLFLNRFWSWLPMIFTFEILFIGSNARRSTRIYVDLDLCINNTIFINQKLWKISK